MKQIIILLIVIFYYLSSCTNINKDNKESLNNIDNNTESHSIVNIKKILKKVKGKNIEYYEYNLNGSLTEAFYSDNGFLNKIIDYDDSNDEIKKSTILEYIYSNNNIKQEIRTRFSPNNPTTISKTSFKVVNKNKVAAIKENNIIDIITDSIGNIIGRIEYYNEERNGAHYYYQSIRDNKGNEQQAIIIEGIVDPLVTKIKYEYLKFDKEGNWVKRKKKYTFKAIETEEFEDYINKKSPNSNFEFPLKLDREILEKIEERELTYY